MSSSSFQVSGESMVPSLIGNHWQLNCPSCQVAISIPLANSIAGELEQDITCWHCGASVSEQQIRASGSPLIGDSVRIAAKSRAIEVGDIVAIHVDGRVRVKRILGCPGDIVSLDGSHLCVAGKRFVASAPLIPVDDDRYRSESRWQPNLTPADGSSWTRENRIWKHQPPQTDWLVYHHKAVYRQSQAAAVMDDYPINTSVVRRLNQAECLAVQITLRNDSESGSMKPLSLEVVFWHPRGVRRMQTELMPGIQATILASATNPVTSNNTLTSELVSPTHPIAIRFPIATNQATPASSNVSGYHLSEHLSELKVMREVEYRIRPQDDSACYPLRLAADQYFVVGDNVPVSVDSRTWGPIYKQQLLGQIEEF